MTQMSPRWNKRWRYDRANGRARYLDPAPTIAHLKELVAAGYGPCAISVEAGLTKSVVRNLITGRNQYVRRDTRDKLLAVTTRTMSRRANPAAFVPILGTHRRLRALIAMGWRMDDIAAAGVKNPATTLHQSGRWVTCAKRDEIAAVYDRLCMTSGPSKINADRAVWLEYPPPLAWDDIDDPDEIPNLGPKSTLRGRFDVEDIAFLMDQEPFTADQIAARLGVVRSAIEHACVRSGRRDLLARMVRNQADGRAA